MFTLAYRTTVLLVAGLAFSLNALNTASAAKGSRKLSFAATRLKWTRSCPRARFAGNSANHANIVEVIDICLIQGRRVSRLSQARLGIEQQNPGL